MDLRDGNLELVGIGLYSPLEAQKLLGLSASKIRRWLRGHTANGNFYEALWQPQIQFGEDEVYLGFRDLMELKTASGFMSVGVSAIAIRRAIIEARKLLGVDHPLSTQHFKTDGRDIFLEIAEEDGDPKLLNLFKHQYEFKKIIDQSLENVDFRDFEPMKWWPMSKSKGVLLDPKRSFGQPIDNETGVPTKTIYQAFQTEKNLAAVSEAWCIPKRTVKHAIEFEESQLKVAA